MWNLSKKVSRPLVFAGAVLASCDVDNHPLAEELRYTPNVTKLEKLCAGENVKKERSADIIFLLPSLLAQKPFKLSIKNEVEGLHHRQRQCHSLFKSVPLRKRSTESSTPGLTSVISLVHGQKEQNSLKPIAETTKAELETANQNDKNPPELSATASPPSSLPLEPANRVVPKTEISSHDLWAHNRHRYQNEFQELDRLGQGSFGTVFRCMHRLDGVEYAVKRIPLPHGEHSKSMREVFAMARLHHSNIIQYFSSWLEPSNEDQNNFENAHDEWTFSEGSLSSATSMSSPSSRSTSASSSSSFNSSSHKLVLYLQMELCSGGTMRDWLMSPQRVNELEWILNIIRQLASALEYIHLLKYIHRDIKPSNIFLLENGTLKLGDFGLTKHLTCNTPSPINPSPSPIPQETDGHTADVGTALYASPEQLDDGVYDCKTDIYSVGVVMVEMLHPPFGTQMERVQVLKQIRNECIPQVLLQSCPRECALVQKLVCHCPAERLSATELLQQIQQLL